MTYATPYTLDAEKYVPIMQPEFKKNIEQETNGQVEVNLAPGGELGTGTKLAQKVQQGTIESAMVSLSNFSPFASEVDLVNLPYFAGTNQQFVNLATSDIWQNRVEKSVRENGYQVAYYLVVDPRSIATGPDFPPNKTPPLTPQGMSGIKHRIPGSDLLQTAWNLAGANPVPVDWSETPTSLQEGVIDSTHNAHEFHAAYGFEDIVSHEVLINAVVDAQVAAYSRKFYQSLSTDLQKQLDTAAEKTFKQQLDKVAETRQNSYDLLAKEKGVKYHELDEGQVQQWKEAMGYQRSEWEKAKKNLAGSISDFEKFKSATTQESKYTVSELTIPPK
ncbi:C4-dicarboxylate ABC transporter [Halobacteriales archaeon QS_3_64_16]|nr:MAG: C4-dicarboxylate ABC transporter [Halobacteriales archaeon QS_3_64_16]